MPAPSRLAASIRLALAAVTGRLTRYEVAGESMRPTLAPGDWTLGVRRPRRIEVGDVVVVELRPYFHVVKRVVDPPTGSDGLWVVGDNDSAPSVDSRSFGHVHPEQVTARLVMRYHPRPMTLI